jgi:hypothetical protein
MSGSLLRGERGNGSEHVPYEHLHKEQSELKLDGWQSIAIDWEQGDDQSEWTPPYRKGIAVN